jgi:Ca2+-transporting ATPase
MVLTNDNFATIVKAVAEGRTIYDNIRKFIRYMVSTNSAEVITVAGSIFAGLPLTMLAIQILWINLITLGLPAVALGFEPAERTVMKRAPRDPKESLFARGMWQQIAWGGIFMGIASMGIYLWGLANFPIQEAHTMVFFTLGCLQFAQVLAIRSERESLFSIGLLSNPYLFGAVGIGVVLQIALLYVPVLQGIFQTVALSPLQLVVCLVVASSIFFAIEIEKAWRRRTEGNRPAAAEVRGA